MSHSKIAWRNRVAMVELVNPCAKLGRADSRDIANSMGKTMN